MTERTEQKSNDVYVSIIGLHAEKGPESMDGPYQIEMIYPGTLKKMGDTWCVRYDEPIEGTKESNKGLIKIRENSLELSKRGEMSTHMVFEEGRRVQTYYETPFASMPMSTTATKVEMSEQSGSIRAYVEYSLEIGGNPVSDCKVEVKVAPRESFSLGKDA